MHLPPFNAALEFKAATNFRYAGHAIVKGQPIDKAASGLTGDALDRSLRLLYENHKIVPMTDDEIAELVVESALSPEQLARVDQLVADNTKDQLLALAPSDTGFSGSATKAEIATAIVKAETAAA